MEEIINKETKESNNFIVDEKIKSTKECTVCNKNPSYKTYVD